MTVTYKTKTSRIDMRVKENQKALLVYAASLRGQRLSAFLLESAIKVAEEITTSQNNFTLPEKQWEAFNAALDRPARAVPKLRKLFKGPKIFHE